MSEFRWNCGGSLHGKDWEEHLPTDSSVSIVLELSIYTVCLHKVVLPRICNHLYSLDTLYSQLHL